MTDPMLQIYLLAIMIVVVWLLLFWKQFRRHAVPERFTDAGKMNEYNRLKRISGIYWIILSLFGGMVIVYAVLPGAYFLFLPIKIFDHPLINTIGLMILKIAVVWIVIAQLHIDKEVYKYFRNIESLTAMELVRYSERMLLSGMLVLFVGIFITITNVVGFILSAIGCFIFFRTFGTRAFRRSE